LSLIRNAKPLPRGAKRKSKAPQTAQQTIPYREMSRDGVCKVRDGFFTKTIEYDDINYAVASSDDQSVIFDGYRAFLNYFDASLPFQLSFVNQRSRAGKRQKVNIPTRDDGLNGIRDEYANMLKGQIARSNNGIARSKYITFGLAATTSAEARPRLERVESDIIGNFKKLGVAARALNGFERLEALHGQLNPGWRGRFQFSWADIAKTGMTTKDFIAPTSFDFRQGRTFRVGAAWGAASYLQIMASELSDRLLAEILEEDAEMTVTMHVNTVDQAKAIKTVKAKLTDIDKTRVEEQKKAARSGYDIDILPPDLVTFANDAKALLTDLQSRDERMFLLTFTIINTAPTRQRLENDIFAIAGVCNKFNCALRRLDFQQERAYMSSLILGLNAVEVQRGMTTSATAIFIPFMTKELRMGGQSLYYGMNALSRNVIMADRKRLKAPNGLYLGVPGSGKSFAAKREIINVILVTNDRVIIIDPMGEYVPLVKSLGPDIGEVIEISPDSPRHINPMDIKLTDNGDDNPLALKADFILSLMELVVGGKEGLEPIERTIIDRSVRLVYRDMMKNPETAETPILQDLYETLSAQPEPEAKRLAVALEIYCAGSLNAFNHHTNVDTGKRVTCIVLNKLGAGLRKIAMHITNELTWAAVDDNFRRGAYTWCYYDEAHLLLRDSLTASYFVTIWKMLRKKACVPSALSQNAKDFLASREIEAILENSEFIVLLAQAAGDREVLARRLGVSPHQLSYVTRSGSGEGLLFYGDTTIPFMDHFPRGKIYDLLTTRPEDLRDETQT